MAANGGTCCLCGGPYEGWGNNPSPLVAYEDGKCCNSCNNTKVIPARIDMHIANRRAAGDKVDQQPRKEASS